MSTFLYARPSDNLLQAATVTVQSGTEDPGYPPENLVDLQPEKPAKLTTTTGAWLMDLGSAYPPEMAAIIHHNLDVGANVRLQANSSDSWGSPPVNLAFTIPARHLDNFPINAWLDIKTLIPLSANRNYRYWRLVVVSVNSAAISVGEFCLSLTKRDLGVRNIRPGSTRTWRRPAIQHETELLVRRSYDLGTTIRSLRADVEPTEAIVADIETWYRSALGGTTPFLIVPHSAENDAWLVNFTNTDLPYVRSNTRAYNTATLEFQEVSRGLYP